MRIVVTGGAGFIGSHLVDKLSLENKNSVTVVDNLHRSSTSNLESSWDRIRFLKADIRHFDALVAAMRDAEVVYHLAAQASVMLAEKDLEYTVSTNVYGTANVLRAAVEAGVRRIVFTSSREVYGDPEQMPVTESAPIRPKNAYGISKAAGEMFCRNAPKSLEISIVRLANVYGTRDHGRVVPIFIENALEGRSLVLNGGRQVIDFVPVSFVVESLLLGGTSETPIGPVNIASGRGVPITGLAEHVIAITGSRSLLVAQAGNREEVLQFQADTTAASRLGLTWRPASLIPDLSDVVEWMRSEAKRKNAAVAM